MDFDLKPIHHESVRSALDKAKHYRLLNEPWEAESICLDVLEIEPENQEAVVTLLLALTDQLPRGETEFRARELVSRLDSEYARTYYGGLIWERKAKAQLGMHVDPPVVYGGLRRAMELYEKAIELRPAGNEDAVLRWNTCVRIIRSHGLRPEHQPFRPYGD